MANINYLRDTTALGVSALIQKQQPLRVRPAPGYQLATPPGGPRTGQMTSSDFWEIVIPISVGLSAYHGYKRHNDSLGWGLGWGLLGGLFPIITPTVAFAEGFGKRVR